MKEFIDKDGLVCYRLDRKKYISKHRFLYQTAHNCKLKSDEAIIFLDGNNRNFNIDNLYKVTRGELVMLNRWYKISSDPNETLDKIALIRLKQRRIEIAKEAGLTNVRGDILEDIRESHRKYYQNHPERKEYYRNYQRERRKDPEYRKKWNEHKRKKRQSGS